MDPAVIDEQMRELKHHQIDVIAGKDEVYFH
jgi:hypothetical protein